jgi:hypothetical protein
MPPISSLPCMYTLWPADPLWRSKELWESRGGVTTEKEGAEGQEENGGGVKGRGRRRIKAEAERGQRGRGGGGVGEGACCPKVVFTMREKRCPGSRAIGDAFPQPGGNLFGLFKEEEGGVRGGGEENSGKIPHGQDSKLAGSSAAVWASAEITL